MNIPPLITHTSNFTPQNFQKQSLQQLNQIQNLYSTQNTNFGSSSRYGSPLGKITSTDFTNTKRTNSENKQTFRNTKGNMRKQQYIQEKHKTDEGQEQARIRKLMNKDRNFVGPYLPQDQYKLFNSQLLNNYEQNGSHFYSSTTLQDMTQQTENQTFKKQKYLHNLINQKSIQSSFTSQMSHTSTAFSYKIQGSQKNMDKNVVFLTKDSIENPTQIKNNLININLQRKEERKNKDQEQEQEEAKKQAYNEQQNNLKKKKHNFLKSKKNNSQQNKDQKNKEQENSQDKSEEDIFDQVDLNNKKFLTFNEILINQKIEEENRERNIQKQQNRKSQSVKINKKLNSNAVFRKTSLDKQSNDVSSYVDSLYSTGGKNYSQLNHNKTQFNFANQQIDNMQNKIFQKTLLKMKDDEERIKKVEKLIVNQKQVIGMERNKKAQQKFDPQLLEQLASLNPAVERQKNKLQESYPQLKNDKNMAQNSVLSYFQEFNNDSQWKPQGRIGSTMTYHNKHLFLIGGRSNELVQDVAMLQLPQYKASIMKWIKVNSNSKNQGFDEQNQDNVKSYLNDNKQVNFNTQPIRKKSMAVNQNALKKQNTIIEKLEEEQSDSFTGRFNHSASLYGNKIVVFGGESSYDSRARTRSCLNQVFTFDTITLKWEYKLCKGDYIEGRRNHAAAVVGNHLIVLGGINGQEKNIDQLIYLDLQENIWKIYGQSGEYQNIFKSKGGLSSHTACPVYEEPKHQKLHNTKNQHRKSSYIKEQGIYYYGGRFNNGKINDQIYVLKTEQFPVHWKILETTGAKPRKRYAHSMNYMQKLNIIIITGGKTEQKDDEIYIDDTFIFNLYTLEWKQVLYINPLKNMDRAFASCDSFGSQFFVFGGMKNEKYFGSTLNILELDQEKVEQLARKKQNQIEQELLQAQASEMNDEEIQKRKSEIIQNNIQNSKRETFLGKLQNKMSQVRSYQPIPSLISQHFGNKNKNQLQKQNNENINKSSIEEYK